MKGFGSVFLLAALVAVVSCSTEPFEERPKMNEPQGPGLFTGEKGVFSFSDYFSDEKKAERERKRFGYVTGNNINMPAIDPESFEDFENFKAWRRAQEPGSENYQEYQDWRAYQAYRRQKAEKEQPKPQQP